MWIAIVAAGIVVLGLAAYAALGHLGEMPAQPVTDNPKGRVPDGPVDADFLARAVLPRRVNGYDRAEVDRYLASVVAGDAEPPETVAFPVTFGGYDMAVIDELLERVARQQSAAADEGEAGAATGPGDATEDVAAVSGRPDPGSDRDPGSDDLGPLSDARRGDKE